MIFNYRALDKRGRLVEGKTEAVSRREAENKLSSLSLRVVEIKQPGAFEVWIKGVKASLGMKDLELDQKGQIEFYKEIQSLLKVGLSPLEAVSYMASPTAEDKNQKLAAQSVLQRMQEGESFSSAIKMAGFPDSTGESLWVGEATGSLLKALEAVIRQEQLNKDVSSGILSVYLGPAISGAVMLAAFVATVIFMVPIQIQVIDSLVTNPSEYPPMSAAVFWMGNWGIPLVGGIFGLLFLSIIVMKTILYSVPSFRLKWDVFKMSFPLFGGFYKYQEYARVTNLLGIALGKTSKQSMVTEMLKNQVNSPAMKDKMKKIHMLVEDKGYTLSQAMQEAEFNSLIATFVKRGEQSGRKDVANILDDITRHFEYKTKHHLEVLKGISEMGNMLLLLILAAPVLLISVGPSLDQVTLMMNKI